MSAIKVYLAGPMRGYKAYNHPLFDLATDYLREAGFEVFSPAEEDHKKFPDRDWARMTGYLKADGIQGGDIRELIKAELVWIIHNADMIVLLPGWEKSKGVAVEKALADFLSIPIRFFDDTTMTLIEPC